MENQRNTREEHELDNLQLQQIAKTLESGFLSAMNWLYHDTGTLVKDRNPVGPKYDQTFIRDLNNMRRAYQLLKKKG